MKRSTQSTKSKLFSVACILLEEKSHKLYNAEEYVAATADKNTDNRAEEHWSMSAAPMQITADNICMNCS